MNRPLPDFSNESLFPPFSACPITGPNPPVPINAYYLLAEIKQEMTISNSPTFICQDLSGQSFAVTIRLPADGVKPEVRGGGYDSKPWKKGHLVLVKNAMRAGVTEAKQGFIETRKEDILIIPAGVEKLIEMHEIGRTKQGKFQEFIATEYLEKKSTLKACEGCQCVKQEEELRRCKGCANAWYCGKECQVKSWNEGGHKSECKIHQAIGSLAAFGL